MKTTSPPDILCARIAQRIADSVGARKYSMWFERSARLSYDADNDRLIVCVPNRFVADWIGRNFKDTILQCADAELDDRCDLRINIRPDLFGEQDQQQEEQPTPAPRVDRPRRQTSPWRHNLDDFIVGPSNQLAFAAAEGIVEPDHETINPLFIHGGCGLGKTHLLQGICSRMKARRPGARVAYMTGEQFTNDFLTAVRTNSLAAFRHRIRKLDLLAVDDVRFIANKQATQQEFLHSFDAIELGGARVVLASDCHPRLIKQFSEALVSRCIRGMVVQVNTPDDATRRRLVAELAQRRGLALNDSVVQQVATRCRQSVREIEGVLARIHALVNLTQRDRQPMRGGLIEVGHAMVDHLFSEDAAAVPRSVVRFSTILETVCDRINVTREQVLGSGRHRQVVLARSVVAYLARQMTSMSFPEIAAQMHRPGHSTMITACGRIQKQIADDKPVLLPHRGEQTTVASLVEQLKHDIARV